MPVFFAPVFSFSVRACTATASTIHTRSLAGERHHENPDHRNSKALSSFCSTASSVLPSIAPYIVGVPQYIYRPLSMAVPCRMLRRLCTSTGPPRLTKFALHRPKFVELEFSDGNVFNLSAEFLRVQSPAADSKIRSINGEKVIFGRRHVGIMSAEPVGNYGIRLVFDDLHKTGIYTWSYFYNLGINKFTLMRNYIKTLKKHGLSRDPRRSKPIGFSPARD